MRSDNTILKVQDVALQALLKLREEDEDLVFTLREKPKSECTLENGYWLPGGKHHINIGFWAGEAKNKTNNLMMNFTITDTKDSILKLNTHDDRDANRFYEALMRRIPGFKRIGKKPVWQINYDGSFFRRTLENFVKNEKRIIDEMIQERQPECFGFLDKAQFEEQLENVIQLRNELSAEEQPQHAAATAQ